jgi:phosphoribosylaminoimidazolecarboxamide formyltransferase/IMP cyclohydrolase
VLGGKQLSYNNLLDLDAALGLALEFAGDARPAASSSSTTTRAASRSATTPAGAYARARAADPVSAFGGIVAVNRTVDAELAALLAETFLECVIAPGYSAEARAVLAGKKNLRLVAAGGTWAPSTPRRWRASARSPAARWCRPSTPAWVDVAATPAW